MFGKIVLALGAIWGFVWFVDGDTYVATMVMIAALAAGLVLCGIAAALIGGDFTMVEVPPGEEEDDEG